MITSRPFSDIRVDEIARQAGVSVGGFYARFKGKNALLHLADIDFLEKCTEAFDEAVPEDFEGPLYELIASFIRVMVSQFVLHKDMLNQFMKFADEDDSSDFRQRATEFNQHVHGRMRRLLSNHVYVFGHSDTHVAINMALFMASASAREAVLKGAISAYPISLSTEELIQELVKMTLAYLKGGRAE